MRQRRQPKASAAKNVLWARRTRDRLQLQLGGKCTACGRTDALEFDCISPMGHKHHGMGFTWRMSWYRKQMRHGNLQLLCENCNSMKADQTQAEWLAWLNTEEGKEYYRLRIKGYEQDQQLCNCETTRKIPMEAL